MNIYAKLTALQCDLKAPKGQYNNFGKYKYRSCEDILEALKPLLKKYDLSLFISDEIVQMGERFYIKATATLFDASEQSDKAISVTAFAREEKEKKGMDGSQVTGASSSYARKYALNGLFAIDDTKDSDATNDGKEITDWRQEYIRTCKEKGIDSIEYAQKHGINKKTTQDEYKDIVTDLKGEPAGDSVVSMNEI